MFDSVIRSVVAEEYHTVFIIVQADLGHLFSLTNGGGSTSPDVVTSNICKHNYNVVRRGLLVEICRR